jgi:lipopolysaccharide biosynthesis regulator YciM
VTWPWIAAAVGVVAVAAIVHLERARRRRDATRAWARGVRSVLSDDSDAAIAALSDAARLGRDEAIDTYLALGALFRRTGDLARAVRLHRNMRVYPGLDPARAAEVERELAEDYRRSGMLAEAAELLQPRAAADRASAELLREVLADQGSWGAAAALQRRLSPGLPDPVLAHLLAAAARGAVESAPAEAAALARQAVEADGRSADALLALGEAEAAGGRWPEALAAVEQALSADDRCAVLAWPALARVGDRAGALAAMERAVAAAPRDAALWMLLGRARHAAGRNGEALDALRRALDLDDRGEVTVAMRDLLRAAEAPGPDDLAARHDLLVAALLKKARSPRCSRCGAEAPRRQWRCRRCGAFDPHR